MRRVSGFVLTLLGAFLLLLAVLLRFWIAPDNVKIPLNQYQITTFTGTGSYLSQATGTVILGVPVKVTTTTKGDVLAGSDGTAVYDIFSSVQDVWNHQPISYFGYRVAFDRKTGEIVRCCGEYVTDPAGEPLTSLPLSGLGISLPTTRVPKPTHMWVGGAASAAGPGPH